MDEREKKLDKLTTRLEGIVLTIERSGLRELLEYRADMRKTFKRTFFLAMVRGVGTAIGVTVLGAFVVYLLQKIAMYNLPLIGDVIAELVNIVKTKTG